MVAEGKLPIAAVYFTAGKGVGVAEGVISSVTDDCIVVKQLRTLHVPGFTDITIPKQVDIMCGNVILASYYYEVDKN